jgi:hypothetical protein
MHPAFLPSQGNLLSRIERPEPESRNDCVMRVNLRFVWPKACILKDAAHVLQRSTCAFAAIEDV